VVRWLLKERFWWISHPSLEIDETNFVWTQWKWTDIINKLVSGSILASAYKTCSKKKLAQFGEIRNTSNGIFSYNWIDDNYHLSSKKAIYWNLKAYYDILKQDYSNTLPLTFHVQNDTNDEEFKHFKEYFNTLS